MGRFIKESKLVLGGRIIHWHVFKYSCVIRAPCNFSVRFIHSVSFEGFNACGYRRQLDYLRQIKKNEKEKKHY